VKLGERNLHTNVSYLVVTGLLFDIMLLLIDGVFCFGADFPMSMCGFAVI